MIIVFDRMQMRFPTIPHQGANVNEPGLRGYREKRSVTCKMKIADWNINTFYVI